MTIELLTTIVTPPLEPIEPGNDKLWQELETSLEFTFPVEFKDCINTFGSGTFSDLLILANPFWKQMEYKVWLEKELNNYIITRDKFPEDFPFAVYPEDGGLFIWANSSNGDSFYWETIGEPDQWPIIVYSARDSEYERWNLSVTDFLCLWLSGEMESPIFATEDIDKIFTPDDFSLGLQ